MWAAFANSVLLLITKVLSIFEKKSDQRQKEVEDANTEEKVRRAEIVRDIDIKDEAEKKVSEIDKATDENEKHKILDDIRRHVS